MRLLGFEITWGKAAVPATTVPAGWNSNFGMPFWGSGSGWFPTIQEPFTGAWQRNQELRVESVLSYSAVYACVTLIASDISKMRLRLMEQDDDDVWSEAEATAFSPVLRKPNRYQTRIKFIEQWVISKLIHGNTYVLKERDQRNVVVRLYVLDPCRVKPMIAPDGSVFYELHRDLLSGVEEDRVMVPASEIIHDTMAPLYHPLCGVSPITACGLAAMQGLKIQRNSSVFFENFSQPGGILSAPGHLNDDTANRMKQYWEDNFTGSKAGKVAVLGDGLKYEAMSVNAVDAQLIEQLKWTAENVCSCFHVPPYMIGVAPAPAYNNIEALNQQYYAQCLQGLIESIELLLDEGLGLVGVPEHTYGTEFDLDDLLRMDSATMADSLVKLSGAGLLKLDEGRKKLGYVPMEGGDAAYLQQQNYSVTALAKRDAKPNPFASAKQPATQPMLSPPDEDDPVEDGEDADEQEDSRDFADDILTWAKHHEDRASA